MSHGPLRQAGMSLVITLVALVLLSLAAVALIRNVDTTNLVAGNLAFKQATTSAADLGTEAAIAWLQSNLAGATLQENDLNNGYYATSLTNLDVSGKSSNAARALADWKSDNCAWASGNSYATCLRPSLAITANGVTTRYVITRMCKTTGDANAAGNGCARPLRSTGSSIERGESSYARNTRVTAPPGPYFRIVVRAEGPRNTVSYTESYVHF